MPTARSVLLTAPLLISTVVFGQTMNSSELLLELQKLSTVGSVLFVAAHPDDENTTLLTYLAQEEKLETAYLSLTRGGGGQNLIGPELKENLGLIRANELLQARKTDGAKQLFTRARDFGYSKNVEDTLENWQEETVLGDVVYAIRFFKPDVIITRFNPDEGVTHGHHTVSAQLALKAFRLAADPNQFPEQLDQVQTHQATRIFWNGYGQRGPGGRGGPGLSDEQREVVSLEIGKYNPLLGTSYTEIAARSRSMHKSQGFGQAGRRGPQTERLVLLDGAPTHGNFLNGIDTTWGRYKGGEKIENLLNDIIKSFDPSAPWEIVSKLIEADKLLQSLPPSRHIQTKQALLQQVIAASMGLHFETRSNEAYVTPGDTVNLEVELTNRSPVPASVLKLDVSLFDSENWPNSISLNRIHDMDQPLESDIPVIKDLNFELPETAPLTQPYWLVEEPDTGIYHFKNDRLLELTSIPSPMAVSAQLIVEGHPIILNTPVIQVLSDPIEGEIQHLVSIRPELVLKPDASVLLFENNESKQVIVTVTGNSRSFSGKLVGDAPKGWSVKMDDPQVSLTDKTSEVIRTATIKPPAGASEGSVFFKVVADNGITYNQQSNQIEYEHIGRQPIMAKAATKLTRLDLSRAGNRIACIEGVGDPVPETLFRIGYEVDVIQVADINRESLKQYDSVILGPRAFDALEGLDKRFDELKAYVEAGGTLISQFNTTASRTKSKFSSPYPLKLSRDRVSEEKVEMRILKPAHRVFNVPNKITANDFENWVQERGLYYADEWDDHYEAVLSANDRGEPARDGGLLIAQYGKGWYAYTGISFFRQLPEGNPGAIRLFVNLISLGHGN